MFSNGYLGLSASLLGHRIVPVRDGQFLSVASRLSYSGTSMARTPSEP